ncbi:MAG: type II toxin-antitoxin system VapC family toxin [Planctomycetes bacterium]|nr:type II toxin-antitoxin system VapC family toxin [Planctomycetota bacterium]
MKVLLDTCTALWVALDAPELSPRAREIFEDPDNEVFLSVVSAWEICLKYALGRLPLPETPDILVAEIRRGGRMASLPLEEPATLQLFRLPPLHRDPFDRMLICQAIAGGMTIVTPDDAIRRYPVPTAW